MGVPAVALATDKLRGIGERKEKAPHAKGVERCAHLFGTEAGVKGLRLI